MQKMYSARARGTRTRRGPGPVPARGVVVVHRDPGRAHGHESVTRVAIARRLALLQGYEFAGEYEPAAPHPGPVYFVPEDTLIGVRAARALGIRSERDLYGGVAPHSFVATKSISHPLVAPDAFAPQGWSAAFGWRVRDAVLPGFTAFTRDDAHRAGELLLREGPLRVKSSLGTGGLGQLVVTRSEVLDDALEMVDADTLARCGVVLEPNLENVTTYSVGQVRVGDLVASYCGTQQTTASNKGETVYGGSDLAVVRGGFDVLLRLALPPEARLAVTQACTYDAAAMECFAGLFASRRNYDVARGDDAGGHPLSGVLEQSWRVGGSSTAELAALELFRADPTLPAARASCTEVYGDSPAPPPGATVYFRDVDPRVGMLTKYALVRAYADA